MVRKRISRRKLKPSTRGPHGWRDLAPALAAHVPIARLHPQALREIRSRPIDETIAIACSGGADSVALLLLLWGHVPERRGQWLVLHFNHALRGAASEEDVTFVRTLARALGEKCVTGVWMRGRGHSTAGAALAPAPVLRGTKRDGASAAPTRKISEAETREDTFLSAGKAANQPTRKISEAEAREARWKFFSDEIQRVGATVIALGHQRDDVAETMLMRLARGSGAGGLAAPRPVQRMTDGTRRVRPLLDLDAKEIRAALHAVGATWRDDETNLSDDFLRNRVRGHVVPALQAAAHRDVLAGFAAARDQLEEDDEALAAVVRELAPPPERGRACDVSMFVGRARALVRRRVFEWLNTEQLATSFSRVAADGLIDAVCAGNRIRSSAGTSRFVEFDGCVLSISSVSAAQRFDGAFWPASQLAMGGSVVDRDGSSVSARVIALTPALRKKIMRGGFSPAECVFVDAAGCDGVLTIRCWQPGDRYRPLGGPGTAKIHDMFVNKKIPRELRGRLPVVCGGQGKPIWVPGLPPAQNVALQPSMNHAVQLTYQRVEATVSHSSFPSQDHV